MTIANRHSDYNWYKVAIFLIVLGSLLWGIHLISESKKCAEKGGYYMLYAEPLPVCLKTEVLK